MSKLRLKELRESTFKCPKPFCEKIFKLSEMETHLNKCKQCQECIKKNRKIKNLEKQVKEQRGEIERLSNLKDQESMRDIPKKEETHSDKKVEDTNFTIGGIPQI